MVRLTDEINEILSNNNDNYKKTYLLRELFKRELPINTVVSIQAFDRQSFGIVVESSKAMEIDLVFLMQTINDDKIYCQHIEERQFINIFSKCQIDVVKHCQSYIEGLECFLSCVKDGKQLLNEI